MLTKNEAAHNKILELIFSKWTNGCDELVSTLLKLREALNGVPILNEEQYEEALKSLSTSLSSVRETDDGVGGDLQFVPRWRIQKTGLLALEKQNQLTWILR